MVAPTALHVVGYLHRREKTIELLGNSVIRCDWIHDKGILCMHVRLFRGRRTLKPQRCIHPDGQL
jgi:hypothetical protein